MAEINYSEQILYGKLQRMAPHIGEIKPILTPYWVCIIDPQLTPKLLDLVKKDFAHTSDQLKHLKRMQKIRSEDGKAKLKAVICAVNDDETNMAFDELHRKIIECLGKDSKATLEKVNIPMNKPFDKDINLEWSQRYWPLLWKGNPLLQELKELHKALDFEKVQKYINHLADLSTDVKPIVTIFVDPVTDTIKATSIDNRGLNDPIKHPVMDGIATIAKEELDRRNSSEENDPEHNNYLCHNYHVYTTHEPCTMCAMALVHSRISQLVYVRTSQKTGAIGKDSGKGEMIHISCSLNWKFEAFQFLDDSTSSKIPEVDENMYV